MSTQRPSIDEEQQLVIDELNSLGDVFGQYTYLLELSATLPVLSDEEKSACTLVGGCQSQVWLLVSKKDDGTVGIRADSDTLIVRGILSLMVSLLDGRTACEIRAANIAFIEKTDLKAAFSDDRLNGFTSICATIKTLSKTIANQ
ncbi:SufE family protein [Raoultibacter massiliensis]|uniref:SufE family protein n=1 Tax=Raoultibacter massiliensis TaxID=1852371 RepID=A0ABV1JE65_9ACTN